MFWHPRSFHRPEGRSPKKGPVPVLRGLAAVLLAAVLGLAACGTPEPADEKTGSAAVPFLSPLAYWGLEESALSDNPYFPELTVLGEKAPDSLEDYVACLQEHYDFTLSKTKENSNGRQYYFTYTGTEDVGSVSDLSVDFEYHLKLSMYYSPQEESTHISWLSGEGLEPVDGGYRGERAPDQFPNVERADAPPPMAPTEPPEPTQEPDPAEVPTPPAEPAPTVEPPQPVETPKPPETSKPAPTPPKPTISGPALPSFAAFTNDCAYESDVGEHSSSTERSYKWSHFNETALAEYVALLQDSYGFTLRKEKRSSDTDVTWSFDYTGPGSVSTVEDPYGWMDEGGELYIWAYREWVHIEYGNGLTCADTGERTTAELEPCKDNSGGGSSTGGDGEWCISCSGTGRCSTCGGTGKVYKTLPGTRERVEVECTSCYRSGQCRDCGGDGKK